ncbi:Lipase A [Lachnellula suecica]|uniref:Lipase A n=1 Tax=Lachnellula suecica TaxID=602035 RepID=A0A8T9CL91_9HELO|nr:Lipase A [Lachnellula suecica]
MASSNTIKIVATAVLALFSATVLASPPNARDVLLPPSHDPWYSHPSGFENASPGTILQYRTPPAGVADFGTIPLNLKSSHQIQFRTTNSQGKPDTAITTLLVPNGGNVSRLVSYQDIQDASYINCAPSYAIQVGSSWNNTFSKDSSIFEGGLLAQGFIVSIPDYQGTEAAFSSGLQAGQATLDSIRAVLSSSSITGISSHDVDVTMWGYSGGSIATGWAAELQPSYAPELKIAGAAIGGTVSNLHNTILLINEGEYAGLGLAGLWGMYQAYTSELKPLMDQELFPENRTECEKPRTHCAGADFKIFDGKDVFSYFKSGKEVLNAPQLKKIIEETGIMGRHDVPQIPLYFYKAKGDEVSSIKDNDDLVQHYCDSGVASLHYVRNAEGSHTSESLVGSGGALAFLKGRFDGVAPVQGCKTDNPWIVEVNWKHLRMFGDELLGLVEDLIGL